ncbi:MAG: hypothetical protein D6704_07745 [Nitrospirae bacterium]|nr:MAG: hypothetical protein D6704_07745 [Nitrospirota bacterium]
MLGITIRRLSIWWRLKKLDRTYQPLLEKAIAFGNREAVLKLEEQYWYQTACLLEERRELRQAHVKKPRGTSSNGHPLRHGQSSHPRFGAERDLAHQHAIQQTGKAPLLIFLACILAMGAIWYLWGERLPW